MMYSSLLKKTLSSDCKKAKNTINSWKIRGLFIYGIVNIIKSILFPKMIYPNSILCTHVEIIKEFQTLIFNFYGTKKTKLFVSQLMHLINLEVLK